MQPTVFVVDDDPGVRAALESLLRSVDLGVKTFASVPELSSIGRLEGPACIVLDVRLPGQSGLDFQKKLSSSHVGLPIIFLTGHGDIPMTVQAMKEGAVEFLTKPFREQDLLDAIRAALAKHSAWLESQKDVAELSDRYQLLSAREREVVSLVVKGKLNKQIAAEIGLSEITVKIHRGRAMRKMQATSLPDLARMCDKLIAVGSIAPYSSASKVGDTSMRHAD
jgi:FixJ family two-component response regulator